MNGLELFLAYVAEPPLQLPSVRGVQLRLASLERRSPGHFRETEVVLLVEPEAVVVGGRTIALAGIDGVVLEYQRDLEEGTIRAQIVLQAGAGRTALFLSPVRVLTREGLGAHPGQLRWIAEKIAEVAHVPVEPESDARREKPPAPDGGPPPSLPSDCRMEGDDLVFEAVAVPPEPSVVASSLLFNALWVTALTAGVGQVSGPYALLAAALGAFLAAGIHLMWMNRTLEQRKVARANGHGMLQNGNLRPWEHFEGLRLEGDHPGPVRLVDGRGRVLKHWRVAGWTRRPRIANIVHFSEHLASMAGTVLENRLPPATVWRDDESRLEARREGHSAWLALLQSVLFEPFRASVVGEEPAWEWSHDGGGLAVGGQRIAADGERVGLPGQRISWTEIEGIDVDFEHGFNRDSTSFVRACVVARRTNALPRRLSPWEEVRIDGPVMGEVLALRDSLTRLWRERAHVERGTREDVPATIRALQKDRN